MSEYDSLKVISQPPFYRWTGLLDIFSCAARLLCLCSFAGSSKGGTLLINAGILLLPDFLTPFFLPRVTSTSFQPLLSGTDRVSLVLVCFSSYMPRPDDTGRPSGITPVLCQDWPFINDSFVSASVTLKTSPSAFLPLTMLYHASRERRSPCGLYDSLCTLRPGRSTVCLSLPRTQHSVQVAGQTDLHPARSTKLCLAH